MKAFKFFLIFLFGGSLVLLLLAWYSGFFITPVVDVQQVEGFVAAYEDHVGAYDSSSEIQERIYNRLWDDGIENYRAFGIFYDDPATTPVDQLRSRIGCIVEPAYTEKIKSLANKYRVFEFRTQRCAVVDFPYRNVFSGYAAMYKAYPALAAYAAKNGISDAGVIEIYEIPKRIRFIMPLGR